MPATASLPTALQAILDAAVDGVVLIDHAGSIEALNQATERLSGYQPAELLGKNVGMLMTDADRAAHDSYLARYLRTGEPHIIGRGREVSVRRKDGTVVPVFLSVGVVPGARPPRFVGFLHDLTLQRQSEERTQQLQERLTHISRFATLGEVAAGIAHEINQPLTAIANYAQACERMLACGQSPADPDPGTEEVRDALRQIGIQAVRAGDIIHRLRGLTRTQDSKRQPVHINTLIAELTDLIASEARRHGVRYRLDLGGGLPQLLVDGAQIQQVLLNLTRNAVEALAEAEGNSKELLVRTHLTRDRDIQVDVCDNGPGVPDGIVVRLFEPFFTTKHTGTGLGLATSRTIAELNGGSLRYRPNEPVGACFYLRLPAL
jgi:two-component system, LuxR family, sensor kinase FixL